MSKNALSYKNPESTKRVRGIAEIKTGDTSCRITFQDENVEFDNGSNSKKFKLDDLPKLPHLSPNSEGEYMVVLNPDGDSVEVVAPVEGVFPAKLVDFSRPDGEDADPTPIEKTTNYNGKEGSYQYFLAFFKVTKGEFKGVQIPYFLHYKFDTDEDGNTVWKGDPGNPKATRLHQLVEFCEKLGMVETPIEYPDDGNVLPELLERGLEAEKAVSIVVKKGYIDSLLSGAVSGDDENETPAPKTKKAPVAEVVDEVDDEFPVKKSAPKAKRVKATVVEEDNDDDL